MKFLPCFFVGLACCLFTACERTGNAPVSSLAPTKDSPAGAAANTEGTELTFEIRLLRMPALSFAEALYATTVYSQDDASLEAAFVASGATVVVRSSVSGAADTPLHDEKLQVTQPPGICEYRDLQVQQASAKKEGREIPTFREHVWRATHEQGYSLDVRLHPEGAVVDAELAFRWLGTPVIRPVDSWPVVGTQATRVEDRKWETKFKVPLTHEHPLLLAAAPEPPQADGKPTGYVLVAIGKVHSANAKTPVEPSGDHQITQCWVLDLPTVSSADWLANRTDSTDDDAQLKRLLAAAKAGLGPVLLGVEMLAQKLAISDRGFVESGLYFFQWEGFEPSDAPFVPNMPVPNEEKIVSVTQRLEVDSSTAQLTMPIGELHWSRWYGSTRGATDEPLGIETGCIGQAQYGFCPKREPGKTFLAHAHTDGALTRLTFHRELWPPYDLPPIQGASDDPFSAAEPHEPQAPEPPDWAYGQICAETNLTIYETLPEPWLAKLAQHADLKPLISQLKAATTAGTASILQRYFLSEPFFCRSNCQATRPWVSFSAYINANIQDGKFSYNPRFVQGSQQASLIETQFGSLQMTLNGEPVSHHFGLWFPNEPGFSAENSFISLGEWPELSLNCLPILPPDEDVLLSVALGRSWQAPERATLHWVVIRHKEINRIGGGHRILSDSDIEAARALPLASFTITAADGRIVEHVTLHIKDGFATYRSGRHVESLGAQALTDAEHLSPADTVDNAPPHQTDILTGLDGLELTISGGTWKLTRSVEPARTLTETLNTKTEDYSPEGNHDPKPIIISYERLYLHQETLTGALPLDDAPTVQSLDGGRQLTIHVRRY